MKLLIVESPAKAKTIKNYLDDSFEVVASIGHFRDLPKSGIGIDEKNDFFVKNWEIDKKKIDPILKSIKNSKEIFLALDPDREGELIAWHVMEICKEKKLIQDKEFKRIEFTAVRKEDIHLAIQNPRDIDKNLVQAAITRRFLDRFFGYKISPITKRRTVFGSSAGRVQSPALKVLAEREKEIDLFQAREFWEISVKLKDKNDNIINCSVIEENGNKVDKFYLPDEKTASELVNKIKNENFFIDEILKKEKKRNPYSPFSNSLLLQDSSSKLGFSPKYTNKLAQELKDGIGSLGALITYHRTDSNIMKPSEINKLRSIIESQHGKSMLSNPQNIFKEKSKFVQQGHEAVTPINISKKPDEIKNLLSVDQFKLYDLIWRRTYASQMSSSINLETTFKIKSSKVFLKATGNIPKFKGFKEIYNFSENNDELQDLPDCKNKENLYLIDVNSKQNFTKPPNRFSEAGLIKKLEELGIGRPSTYVSIFTKLEERNYVKIQNKSLIPTSKGKILSKFLDGFFLKFVDFKFTANLEEQLDLITESKINWKDTLNDFLKILNSTVKEVEQKSITEVINKINEISPEILKEKNCPKCEDGRLTIKFSYTGPFIGCTNFNKEKDSSCKYSYPLGSDEKNKDLFGDGLLIGIDTKTNKKILLKSGKYGRYLELVDTTSKPKRVSIPKNIPNDEIDISSASKLLSLPRLVGIHPESKKDITASIGPYGPYIKHENKFISLKDDDVLEVGINRAVELINQKKKQTEEVIIGIDPESKKKIVLKKGIKGRPDYFSINKKNFSLPEKFKDKKITLKEALEIINEKKNKKKK